MATECSTTPFTTSETRLLTFLRLPELSRTLAQAWPAALALTAELEASGPGADWAAHCALLDVLWRGAREHAVAWYRRVTTVFPGHVPKVQSEVRSDTPCGLRGTPCGLRRRRQRERTADEASFSPG